MLRLGGVVTRCTKGVELVLGARHGTVTRLVDFGNGGAQQAPRTGTDWLASIWVIKADQEEGHIVFPRDATKAGQIHLGQQILVAILFIADCKFSEVGLVVHVPAEGDTTEAKA